MLRRHSPLLRAAVAAAISAGTFAGAAQAQGTFDYATGVTPVLQDVNKGHGTIDALGTAGFDLTAPQTSLTLATFNVLGTDSDFLGPFTLSLTVSAPWNQLNPQTQALSAEVVGSFTSGGFLNLTTKTNSTTITGTQPLQLVFDFGQNGVYTFSDFQYTPLVGNPTLKKPFSPDGILTADVSYDAFSPSQGNGLPSTVAPEPSSVLPFGLAGLGAVGLMLKARRRSVA